MSLFSLFSLLLLLLLLLLLSLSLSYSLLSLSLIGHAMPSAFVTGATGFVGSNLVAHLRKQNWKVGCLVRDLGRAKPLQKLGATLHLGTLNEPESLERVANYDTIFHVAGRVRALSGKEFATDNVEGTRNVVSAAAAQAAPPVVVMVSSLAAGGPSRPGTPSLETDNDRPISAYGQSKLAAERAAAEFANQVPISIIRPPIIFGPADKASLAIFQGVKRLRLHAVPGLRRFPVSLVHVSDLCAAMQRIAEQGQRLTASHGAPFTNQANDNGLYHVAAERTILYSDLGKLAAQAIGCTSITLPLPRALFWLVGGAAEISSQLRRRPGVINLDKIREAVASGWECNDAKIRQELGYQPAASLEQRFAETVTWYLDQGWL